MNEARNLELVLPELPEVHEVILVDGKSVDGTVETARRVLPGIKIVHQTRRGKGNALACGFAAVTGDIVVMFDADCSADPAEIPRFVHALLSGADFAKGSRFEHGGGSADITRLRRAGNRGLNLLANRMLKARYTDLCYGYNAFWADILPVLDLPEASVAQLHSTAMIWGDGFEIETVINCRIASADLLITEVPSYERLRVHGSSNLNAISDGLRVLKTIGTERRRREAWVAAAGSTSTPSSPPQSSRSMTVMSTLPEPSSQPWRVVVVDSRPLWRVGLCQLLSSELGTPVAGVHNVGGLPTDGSWTVVVSGRTTVVPRGYVRVCTDEMSDVSDLAVAVVAARRGSPLVLDEVRTLTKRERSVLLAVGRGLYAAEIGDELGISVRTVERHRQAASAKLGARNPAQAVALCLAHASDR